MQFILTIKNSENLDVSHLDKQRFEEIFTALIQSGGLTGVKGGKTIIHFDQEGTFQKIQLDYYPWQKRNQKE